MKGYITIEYEGTERVEVADVIDQIPDELLKLEAIERGITEDPLKLDNGKAPLSGNKDENRRAMCDLLGLNYHTSKENIISELKTRL